MKGKVFLQPADPSNHAPGMTFTTRLDLTWTTFVDHKMATAQDDKSLLVSYGARRKPVKQVHNHKALYKNPQNTFFFFFLNN